MASKGTLLLNHGSQSNAGLVSCHFKWHSKSMHGFHLPHQKSLFLSIALHCSHMLMPVTIPIHTECKRLDVSYRSHPNCQGKGQWCDWVLVQWEIDESSKHTTLVPAMLLCVIDLPDVGLSAAIVSCDEKTKEQHGVFCNKWKLETHVRTLEPVVRFVPLNCLEGHAFLLPHDPQKITWMEVWNKELWPDCFN